MSDRKDTIEKINGHLNKESNIKEKPALDMCKEDIKVMPANRWSFLELLFAVTSWKRLWQNSPSYSIFRQLILAKALETHRWTL